MIAFFNLIPSNTKNFILILSKIYFIYVVFIIPKLYNLCYLLINIANDIITSFTFLFIFIYCNYDSNSYNELLTSIHVCLVRPFNCFLLYYTFLCWTFFFSQLWAMIMIMKLPSFIFSFSFLFHWYSFIRWFALACYSPKNIPVLLLAFSLDRSFTSAIMSLNTFLFSISAFLTPYIYRSFCTSFTQETFVFLLSLNVRILLAIQSGSILMMFP